MPERSPIRLLVVLDHADRGRGPRELYGQRGAIDVTRLRLPFWQDSCLSRTMRLQTLSAFQRVAVEAEAQTLMDALHEALLNQGITHAQGQYLRQVLETHTVTPLVEGIGLVEAAAADCRAMWAVGFADLRSRDWWSGQAVAATAANEVTERHALHRRGGPSRAIGKLVRLALASSAGLVWDALRSRVIYRRAGEVLGRAEASAKQGRKPARADVLILAAGPVVEGLAVRLAEKVSASGATVELARDPLAGKSPRSEEFVVLGSQAGPMPSPPAGLAGAVLAELEPTLSPTMLAALKPRLVSLEAREVPLAQWLGADAEALLDAVQPRVVVDFHFLPRMATPCLVAARRRKIATVCCQHGLIPALDYPSPWYDDYLVFNEYTARVIKPMIGEAARIKVVGNPTLDALAGWQPPAKREGEGRPVVLLATQPNDPPGSEKQRDWWFAVIARACAAVGAEAQVKLHPQQSPEREGKMYGYALDRAGCARTIIAHGTAALRDLIAGCDVFVSQFSTTILEAMALGKPVVFLELREGPPFYPFDDFGAALRVTRPEDAEAALRRAMSDDGRAEMQAARAEFSARHLEPWDGHALDRMARAILRHEPPAE